MSKLEAKSRLQATSEPKSKLKLEAATQKEAIKFIKSTAETCGLKVKVKTNGADMIEVQLDDVMGAEISMLIELMAPGAGERGKPVLNVDIDSYDGGEGGLFGNDSPRIFSLSKDSLRDIRHWEVGANKELEDAMDVLREQKEWVKQFTRFIERLSQAALDNGAKARES